jgi:hypothetical protein
MHFRPACLEWLCVVCAGSVVAIGEAPAVFNCFRIDTLDNHVINTGHTRHCVQRIFDGGLGAFLAIKGTCQCTGIRGGPVLFGTRYFYMGLDGPLNSAQHASQPDPGPPRSVMNNGLAMTLHTLAMLNIEPPEPKNSGSNADDPINLAHLLAMLHIVDLIC